MTSPIVYATIAEYEFKKHQLEKYRYNQGKVRPGDFINKYSEEYLYNYTVRIKN